MEDRKLPSFTLFPDDQQPPERTQSGKKKPPVVPIPVETLLGDGQPQGVDDLPQEQFQPEERQSYRDCRHEGHANGLPPIARSAIIGGVIGLVAGMFFGLLSSQFFPMFAGVLERNLAQPFSPARLGLIPIHLFLLGLIGSVIGAVVGVVAGANKDAHRY